MASVCIYLIKHYHSKLFCSPRLHLFDQNTVKTVKYYYNLKQLLSVWIYCKMHFIPVNFPVFSVTWSMRNHSNMLICCSRNISDNYQCWRQLCCFIFLWKLIFNFSGFFDEQKVQKNCTYLKYKYFITL